MTTWRGKGGPWHGLVMAPNDIVAVASDQVDRVTITGQDALDGAALRRLRESLREDDVIVLRGPRPDDGYWEVDVLKLGAPGPAEGEVEDMDGATIAEAADKCREALP